MPVLNINVGVLGHVDSGKTSLAKAMSTVASTSAFDKNPQSKIRGITLDLGFSSFTVDAKLMSTNFLSSTPDLDKVQFTLVDCPGHGSLIRTVLCGAKIIDIMLLVVDVVKGFQTQTAECLVIGSIVCDQMIVVLNKCDLLPEPSRNAQIEKTKKRVMKTLETTKFKDSPVIAVSAAPGGVQVDFREDAPHACNEDIEALIRLLARSVVNPTERRQADRGKDFLFAVDHCFSITGQGTVMTGTVLSGMTRLGDLIELPYHRLQKKIKSIQMFRQPVNSIGPGDRAGICVAQLDPSCLERGLVGSPSNGNLTPCYACILAGLHRIAYFKTDIKSKARMHVFVGQETALATMTFFTLDGRSECSHVVDLERTYEYLDIIADENVRTDQRELFVLLEFERPLVCPKQSLVIGAKLDSDSTSTSCRLAFHGTIALQITDRDYRHTVLPRLAVYRRKSRRGQIDRVMDPRTVIVRGLFKRETNWDIFIGLRAYVHLADKDEQQAGDVGQKSYPGRIESSFGQSGKCRLVLDDDLPDVIVKQFSKKPSKKALDFNPFLEEPHCKASVILEFKRYVFDPKRQLIQ